MYQIGKTAESIAAKTPQKDRRGGGEGPEGPLRHRALTEKASKRRGGAISKLTGRGRTAAKGIATGA